MIDGSTEACSAPPSSESSFFKSDAVVTFSPFSFVFSILAASTTMSGSIPLAWIDRPEGGERDDGLDRSLAERPRAEQDRPVVILQRAGDDLAGRSGAAIDQHDH